MKDVLINYLRAEKYLLEQLVALSDKQKDALVKYDISGLESITLKQWELSKEIKQVEEQRITLVSSWLGIKKTDAMRLKLSDVINIMKEDDNSILTILKNEFKALLSKLQTNQSLNRVLASRARNSLGELLHIMTNGSNHVCNVKI